MSSGFFQEQAAMSRFRTAQAGRAFTLIELMIVCTIIAILSLTAIPLYTTYTTSAIVSEGVAGTGAIRTALRIYRSQYGTYAGATLPVGDVTGTLAVGPADLDGKYFAQTDYYLSNVSTSTYTIKAGPPSRTTHTDMPYYQIDQDGHEQGTWTSGW
jgi:prepilin-type N-terminal cleavage/methylation domain-containing protein